MQEHCLNNVLVHFWAYCDVFRLMLVQFPLRCVDLSVFFLWTILCDVHNNCITVLGGPYSLFAGKDASRALGKMAVDKTLIKDDDDDLSDLTSAEMDSIREWETQFSGKPVRP